VATLTNGRQVYTYVNLDRVRTRGVELGVDVAPLDWLEVGLRYQYLDAVDLGVLEDIDAGRLFRRENGIDRLLRREDYGGLFGRSRHSGSVDMRLHTPVRGLTASARGVIRSSYGDFDRNGNLVLDDDSEYVGGYVLLNGTLSYAAAGWLTLQAGVENALDYTDPAQAPALPGRRWFGGIRLTRVNH
jgi:outer membrane receptor for ferrienterochelin and colicins